MTGPCRAAICPRRPVDLHQQVSLHGKCARLLQERNRSVGEPRQPRRLRGCHEQLGPDVHRQERVAQRVQMPRSIPRTRSSVVHATPPARGQQTLSRRFRLPQLPDARHAGQHRGRGAHEQVPDVPRAGIRAVMRHKLRLVPGRGETQRVRSRSARVPPPPRQPDRRHRDQAIGPLARWLRDPQTRRRWRAQAIVALTHQAAQPVERTHA